MNLCIVFDRETEPLPTLTLDDGGIVHWIPGDPGFERRIGWYQPTLIVIDLRRHGTQTGEIVARTRLAVPGAAVLVLGAPRDFEAAETAMRSGAAGYVTRPANLVPAIRAMRSDRMYVSGTGRKAVTRRFAGGAKED